MYLSTDELVQREPIWIALSDLFLDSDVSHSYDYIVRACGDSVYSIDELKCILQNEVAPVVSLNLLSVTGEWQGFDKEWLINSIVKKVRFNHSFGFLLLQSLKNIGFKKYIRTHWNALEPKIIKYREKT